MFTLLIVLLIIVCVLLVILILLQPSEGRGLSDTFGGGVAESILGSKASSFLTRTTAVLAVLFFIICIALTIVSVKRSRSLFEDEVITKEESKTSQKTQEKEDVKKQSQDTKFFPKQSTQE